MHGLPPLSGASRFPLAISSDSLLVILVQRSEKRHERRSIAGIQGDALQFRSPVSQRSCACKCRCIPIERHDVGQRVELAVVHVRCGVAQITKGRSLEAGDSTIQEYGIGRARYLAVAQDRPDLRLRGRHIGVGKDIPHAQVRQGSTARGNRAKAVSPGWMLFGGGKIVGGSGGKDRDRQNKKITCRMKAVVFPLCGAGIVQLEIGKVRRRMTCDAIADLSRRQLAR